MRKRTIPEPCCRCLLNTRTQKSCPLPKPDVCKTICSFRPAKQHPLLTSDHCVAGLPVFNLDLFFSDACILGASFLATNRHACPRRFFRSFPVVKLLKAYRLRDSHLCRYRPHPRRLSYWIRIWMIGNCDPLVFHFWVACSCQASFLLQTGSQCPSRNERFLVELKACEKFYRKHIVDIPRIKFFAQRRDRAKSPFMDGH